MSRCSRIRDLAYSYVITKISINHYGVLNDGVKSFVKVASSKLSKPMEVGVGIRQVNHSRPKAARAWLPSLGASPRFMDVNPIQQHGYRSQAARILDLRALKTLCEFEPELGYSASSYCDFHLPTAVPPNAWLSVASSAHAVAAVCRHLDDSQGKTMIPADNH